MEKILLPRTGWSTPCLPLIQVEVLGGSFQTIKKQKLKCVSGLTPGLLRVIHKQVGHSAKVTAVTLSEKWKGVCLHQQDLDHLLLDGKLLQ